MKLIGDEAEGLVVVEAAGIRGKTDFEVDLFDLLLKQILFVEEKDDRSRLKPLIVDNVPKQFDRFVHSVDRTILFQHQIVSFFFPTHTNRRPSLSVFLLLGA